MTVPSAATRLHGYHRLRVQHVVAETTDTRSYAFEVPDELRDLYTYRAGQFCSVRIHTDGDEAVRCYSMSSAPSSADPLTITVKRVPGGLVSNWLHDHVAPGDELELSPPAGVFCTDAPGGALVAFCGGSGITPVMSIIREVLATTPRPVHLLYANRSAASVIFADALAELAEAHPGRLSVRHHLDERDGLLTADHLGTLAGHGADAEYFICGPTPFMDLVEGTLQAGGVEPGRIALERFSAPVPTSPPPEPAAEAATTLTMALHGKRTTVEHRAGDTVLDSARRAGLKAPSSCELGNCATCMARLTTGTARMRANTALTAEEVAEGWVLTCQALPTSANLVVEWEDL